MTRLATTAFVLFLAQACCAFAESSKDERPASFATNLELLEELAREIIDSSVDEIPVRDGEAVLLKSAEGHEIAWVVENYLAGRLWALGASVYVDMTEQLDGSAAEDRFSAARREGPKRQRPGAPEAMEIPGRGWADSAAVEEADERRAEPDTSSAESPPPGEGSSVSRPEGGVAAGSEPDGPARETTLFREAPVPDKVLVFCVSELEVAYPRRWRKSLFGSTMVERWARATISFRLLDGADGRVLWTDSGRRETRNIVPERLLAELEDLPGDKETETSSGGIGRIVEPVVVSGIVVGLVLLFYSSRT